MRRIVFALLAVLVVTAAASPTLADGRSASVEKEATGLYQGVMSPFCAGRSLNDCPSSKAQELKDEMRARLEAGESRDVILEDVIARYGEQYRAVPLFAGFGIFVWVVPVGFVLLGLVVALFVSSGRKRTPVAPADGGSSVVTDDMVKKLQDELRKLD